jgi:hypothetical protein
MTNSNASIKPVVSEDMVIRIGKAKYTAQQSLEHGAAVYESMYDLNELMLHKHNELGMILLQHRALYKSDKLFGKYIANTPLGCMSRYDRTDAMFIASNWDKVRKMNKDGSLDSLGVSAIRKRLNPKKAKPDAPTSAGNVSKGKAKPKAEATDGPSITKTDAADLSKLMEDPKSFGKLIADLVNKNYTDIQIQAFAHEMASHVILDLRQ